MAEAKALYRRALAGRDTALGSDHPCTKIYRDNLRQLLLARLAVESTEAEKGESPPPKGG